MGSLDRRGFLSGVFGFLAAPAIVRVANIMPVKVLPALLPPEVAVDLYTLEANEAVRLWSRKLAREALRKTYIRNFMGEA